MRKIEIKPLVGIVIENIGEVRLAQHKNDLYTLLGPPSVDNEDSLFYDELEVRFDVGPQDTVEFIEFIYGPFPEKTELLLYGVNPFTIGADKLLEILAFHNQAAPDAAESPYCYTFLNTSVGVWRDLAPQDLEHISDDMRDAHSQEDLRKAQNFWTIGIGVPGYYQM